MFISNGSVIAFFKSVFTLEKLTLIFDFFPAFIYRKIKPSSKISKKCLFLRMRNHVKREKIAIENP